ncbi:ATP-dependent DNA ligase [Saccharopolyspora terrae]|uniref:ATP-dependent DNA ligase n=1 Tax=Saccharopolyspora terrae TaxID=2530384 RepID=UPI0014046D3D|nr:RNA ligase family protein [Saccharopolyspora terrae]
MTVTPPVQVATATSAGVLPTEPGQWAYEPKLDGYRVVGFTARRLLQSRQGSTALTDRFPEVVGDLVALGEVVVDGELVALRGGRLTFSDLQSGPARRARDQVTAVFVVFDLLAFGDQDLRTRAYLERRAALGDLLAQPLPHVQLIEHTMDLQTAGVWMSPDWGEAGIEGVVAKPRASRYAPGQRSGWLKIRQTHTVDAAVLGVIGADTLVLGYPDRVGRWRVLGLSLPVTRELRAELAARLRLDDVRSDPVRLPGIAGGLPGSAEVTYQPVLVNTVVEVAVDTAAEYGRQRHRSRVLRIRDDLAPADLLHG